ncbi:hypothetical protein [Nonomuraea sp. SBT364]|uniref:hypothetical protein n=1 Tax=Nonomuraea sp. SBT364 TaxID=1580530 RepID=UPI00066AB7B6|nr:hypothetical protein [Nonomuraea sp. SBT364]
MTDHDAYARAVREALARHPEREELLEDLDDHLAEIAAESDAPLEDRLGPPAAYAEELRAAYGGRPEAGKGRRGPREIVAGLRARVRRHRLYGRVTGFLGELRPGWWVLRGYALAMAGLALATGPRPASAGTRLVPGDAVELLVVVAAVAASVWFGGRRGGWPVVSLAVAVAVNVVAAVALVAGMVAGASGPVVQQAFAPVQQSRQPDVVLVGSGSPFVGDVSNIKPYKDGKPLTGVDLYDQDGRPLVLSPEEHGFELDPSCGEVLRNRYPLPLVTVEQAEERRLREQEGEQADVVPAPSACATSEPG